MSVVEIAAAPSKSERTRRVLVDAALTLFREKGYDATTMRAIAEAAGVSTGNAYYHFESKEHLIQAFYDRAQDDHLAAVAPLLAHERDLERRIVATVDAWLDIMDPYRAFAASFFRNAADPASPLSPFSTESSPARDQAIELWRTVIDGSDMRVAKVLRNDLPEIMWLGFMGVVLFWVHDRSPDAQASRMLARRVAPMVVRLVTIAKLPLLRDTVRDLVELVGDLKQTQATTDPA
jgi:AcrR family transcriptional regulator